MDILGEVLSGGTGVITGGGVVWWLIGNKLKELALNIEKIDKDVEKLKTLAVNDKLQDQKITTLEDGYEKHHKKLGEQDIKYNELTIHMAVINEKLDNNLKMTEKILEKIS